MSSSDSDRVEVDQLAKWDPEFTQRAIGFVAPALRRYFRAEVRGSDNIPAAGGALLVSNHSGGQFALDVPILAVEFYEKFGYGRPMTTLAHDILFSGPLADVMPRIGLIRANPQNAANALRSGHIVVVFPGADYDAYRPTFGQNVIDFNGRKGYVRTAIDAGVPIVPAVSIGGQENQFYLTRGDGLAKRLGAIARRARLSYLPISIGIPFGLSIGGLLPPNVPLPTKIVTLILEPIDITAQFGKDPDIDEVDTHVRDVMQSALDKLSDERRFPILG
jgi:1-acyl-sn-glycerol-3-phosphate acyltransferase